MNEARRPRGPLRNPVRIRRELNSWFVTGIPKANWRGGVGWSAVLDRLDPQERGVLVVLLALTEISS